MSEFRADHRKTLLFPLLLSEFVGVKARGWRPSRAATGGCVKSVPKALRSIISLHWDLSTVYLKPAQPLGSAGPFVLSQTSSLPTGKAGRFHSPPLYCSNKYSGLQTPYGSFISYGHWTFSLSWGEMPSGTPVAMPEEGMLYGYPPPPRSWFQIPKPKATLRSSLCHTAWGTAGPPFAKGRSRMIKFRRLTTGGRTQPFPPWKNWPQDKQQGPTVWYRELYSVSCDKP